MKELTKKEKEIKQELENIALARSAFIANLERACNRFHTSEHPDDMCWYNIFVRPKDKQAVINYLEKCGISPRATKSGGSVLRQSLHGAEFVFSFTEE